VRESRGGRACVGAPLLCLAFVMGCKSSPPAHDGAGGNHGVGGQASGGAIGVGGTHAGGGGMGGNTSPGTGGEQMWEAGPCEPAEFPVGAWTPNPWEPHEDDPTCEHVPVEAKCADGWCEIPAGCFVAGASPDDYGAAVNATKYTVRLTHSFEMQQAEFGRSEWLDLGLSEPELLPADRRCPAAACPVAPVTWFSSLAAANALSEEREKPKCYELSGCSGEPGAIDYACTSVTLTTETTHTCEGYRLPTQAEWEYAYRAGTQTAYYSGNVKDNGPFPRDTYCYDDPNLSKIGWYCFNAQNVQPSKCRQPNRWGLYDMPGNLLEWTSSSSRIGTGPTTDPQATLDSEAPAQVHAVGGSIYLWPAACAASLASTTTPKAENGFRLVRTLEP
jgi:formylglycine-generating enzyme required for sulfatase activity